MKPPAFQFYPDDFIGGVSDMTQSEVGAYILLLCHQWNRGEIPGDPARAAMIAKGDVSPHVMAKFPTGKSARLERVRADQAEYRAAQSNNGKAGAVKRWHGDPNGTAIATPMAPPSSGYSDPNGETIANTMARNNSPTPSPPPTLTLTPDPIPKREPKTAAEGFEEFWQAYPRKTAKAHALRSWNRDKPDIQKVLAALEWQKRDPQWTKDGGQFIPYPASYLNAKKYEDERPKPPPRQSCLGPMGFPKGHSFL